MSIFNILYKVPTHIYTTISQTIKQNKTMGFSDECPTKEQMIASLKLDFLKHGLYEIIELGKESYSTFSGGFYSDMTLRGDDCFVNIFFDIAHFTK